MGMVEKVLRAIVINHSINSSLKVLVEIAKRLYVVFIRGKTQK